MKIEKYQQVWSLWINHEDAIKKYVLKYTKNEITTEDLAQDILLKVHNSCCSNKEIKNIRSWLFQIAHNRIMDFFKQTKKACNSMLIDSVDDEGNIYKELSFYIEPLISFLPRTYGVPLQMADIEGLKQQVIANKLNLSLTATKSRVQRARKLLKKEITTCFHTTECCSGLTDFKLKENCLPLKQWNRKLM